MPYSSSPYAANAGALVQQLTLAFQNQFNLIAPALQDNALPGERFGRLQFVSLDVDTGRPATEKVRIGIETKVFRAVAIVQVAYEAGGLTDDEAYRLSNKTIVEELLGFDHGFAAMKSEINNYDFAWDLEIEPPVDSAVSVLLKDRDTWLCTITADLVLRIVIRKDANGCHVPME